MNDDVDDVALDDQQPPERFRARAGIKELASKLRHGTERQTGSALVYVPADPVAASGAAIRDRSRYLDCSIYWTAPADDRHFGVGRMYDHSAGRSSVVPVDDGKYGSVLGHEWYAAVVLKAVCTQPAMHSDQSGRIRVECGHGDVRTWRTIQARTAKVVPYIWCATGVALGFSCDGHARKSEARFQEVQAGPVAGVAVGVGDDEGVAVGLGVGSPWASEGRNMNGTPHCDHQRQ